MAASNTYTGWCGYQRRAESGSNSEIQRCGSRLGYIGQLYGRVDRSFILLQRNAVLDLAGYALCSAYHRLRSFCGYVRVVCFYPGHHQNLDCLYSLWVELVAVQVYQAFRYDGRVGGYPIVVGEFLRRFR
jgi:hypothetical protein